LAGDFAGQRPPPFREPHRIGALLTGSLRPPSWSEPRGPAADPLFELKGVLEALCAGLEADVSAAPEAQPFLHPGRAARIDLGGRAAGWLGELHPLVCEQWDLPGGVAFELDLAPLAAAARSGHEAYEDVTTHPAVLQDIAVVVADDVPAERVRAAVIAGGGELLREAGVFDLYRGEQVGDGRKSLALRLAFQAPDRTLTDDEVAVLRERIEAELEKVGGSLRE
jgi:phenylalanyl-tRNA synthetase beta chain